MVRATAQRKCICLWLFLRTKIKLAVPIIVLSNHTLCGCLLHLFTQFPYVRISNDILSISNVYPMHI